MAKPIAPMASKNMPARDHPGLGHGTMNIGLITQASPKSRSGNRVTALRWARLLRSLGHRVGVHQSYDDRTLDVMIALHARKSYPSIERFSRAHPGRPLIVALTGTDLYGDTGADPQVHSAFSLATRLIALQPLAAESVPQAFREKVRVIHQSAQRPSDIPPPADDLFEVCVVGHLRPVKDPFLAADALRMLPASSRLRLIHIGAALSPEMEKRAREETSSNPRYRWPGVLRRQETLRRLAAGRALIVTSQMEGGANVVSEAIVCGVPVLSTRIPGSVGLLGEDYPGYFPVGDAAALARLLERVEQDRPFYQALKAECATRAPLFEPARERQAWEDVLGELGVTGGDSHAL